jgi:cytochrome c-type biogenesis protein CcmF
LITLGQIILSIPLALSLLYFLTSIKKDKKVSDDKISKNFTLLIFISTVISFLFLLYKYYISDFYYQNVFTNSHTSKPDIYKLSGAWGNHEGSMLLFLCIVSIYSFLYSIKSEFGHKASVLFYQNFVFLLLIIYIYFFSSPFEINELIAQEIMPRQGLGLNPLLQDIGLAIHPPILYLGYGGYSLAYSIAIVALTKQVPGKLWCEDLKGWSLISWALLTLGVALGSWWAYRELGWGGYWFWDPVENISLMPWLLGTALIHSLLYTRKFEGAYKLTLYLAISTMIFSLIGFFLVRSGILLSVHSFANAPARGTILLTIILIFIVKSFYLIIKYSDKIKFESNYEYNIFSRQFLVLSNVIFYLTLTATIFLALFYPIVTQIFFDKLITVGEPYFLKIFVPIVIASLLFMVFTPYFRWHKNKFFKGFKKTTLSFIISFVLSLYFLYTYKIGTKLYISIFLGFWLVLSLFEILIVRALKREKTGKGFIAMIVSHIGFGLLVLSISFLTMFESTEEVLISKDEKIKINNGNIVFKGSEFVKESNYLARINNFELIKKHNGKEIKYEFSPEERVYFPGGKKTNEADIKRRGFDDYYMVTSGISDIDKKNLDPEESYKEVIILKYFEKPFINLLWLSAIIIALGAFISAYKPREKKK